MTSSKQTKIKVSAELGDISGEYNFSDNMRACVLIAHGAGAGMQHPFMVTLAEELNKLNIGTLRYNLPYMEAGKKFPGSPKHSIEGIHAALKHVTNMVDRQIPVFLSGKSYGGRMSSHVAEQLDNGSVAGLIYYGFPLHAPGKPDIKRASHLVNIDLPMLFLQGSNDNLADQELLNQVTEELHQTTVKYYEHADHSFKRPKKINKESLIPQLAKDTSEWIDQVS